MRSQSGLRGPGIDQYPVDTPLLTEKKKGGNNLTACCYAKAAV